MEYVEAGGNWMGLVCRLLLVKEKSKVFFDQLEAFARKVLTHLRSDQEIGKPASQSIDTVAGQRAWVEASIFDPDFPIFKSEIAEVLLAFLDCIQEMATEYEEELQEKPVAF